MKLSAYDIYKTQEPPYLRGDDNIENAERAMEHASREFLAAHRDEIKRLKDAWMSEMEAAWESETALAFEGDTLPTSAFLDLHKEACQAVEELKQIGVPA